MKRFKIDGGGPSSCIEVRGDENPDTLTQVTADEPNGSRRVYYALGSLAGLNLVSSLESGKECIVSIVERDQADRLIVDDIIFSDNASQIY